MPGEELPLESKSVDTVPVTFSQRSIDEAVTVLEGMRRVLKTEDRLLFCVPGAVLDPTVRR